MAIWCASCETAISGPLAYEKHLVAKHPEVAYRGLCSICASVVRVEHSSEGAQTVEHVVNGVVCDGSGRPPHRSTLKEI
jgi:hypothetical protein